MKRLLGLLLVMGMGMVGCGDGSSHDGVGSSHVEGGSSHEAEAASADHLPARAVAADPIDASEKLLAEHFQIEKDDGNVVSLDCSTNSATDAMLLHLKGLTSLERLRLSNNSQITDIGLVHLKGLSKLQELWLEGTKISDAGLEPLDREAQESGHQLHSN